MEPVDRLQNLRVEGKNATFTELAQKYWELESILEKGSVSKQYLHEMARQMQFIMQQLSDKSLKHKPKQRHAMVDFVHDKGVATQQENGFDDQFVKARMDIIASRVGFKQLCNNVGIDMGFSSVSENVDVGIHWRMSTQSPFLLFHVQTIYDAGVRDYISNPDNPPFYGFATDIYKTYNDLHRFGLKQDQLPIKKIRRFWNSNWKYQGTTEPPVKAYITLPNIFDQYGDLRPECEAYSQSIGEQLHGFKNQQWQ